MYREYTNQSDLKVFDLNISKLKFLKTISLDFGYLVYNLGI